MTKCISNWVAALLIMVGSVWGQTGPAIDLSDHLWQSFTNMRNVKSTASTPEGLWAATTGGMLHWNLTDQRFEPFTNTEGLSKNETAAIAKDNRGRIWIGYSDGVIDIYNIESNTFETIIDFKGFDVRDFFAVGDSMYIALGIGVSLYLIDREEVKETYKNLGARFNVETPANSIFIEGQDIWVATDFGIARSSLDLPNLLAPESWINYTISEGLKSNQVAGITSFQGRIIAALSNGVTRFDGVRWEDVSGIIGDRTVLQVLADQNNVYAVGDNRLYSTTDLSNWNQVGPDVPRTSGAIIDQNATVWLTTNNAGLFEYDANSNTWLSREPDGPATNNISAIALDAEGHVWCTSASSDLDIAFMVYDGQRWRNFSSTDAPTAINNDSRHIEILQNGERWIGTAGRGITVVGGADLDNLNFSRIDASNGILSGSTQSDPSFVVIRFIKQDNAGNVWVCNFTPNNGNVIAVYTPEGDWRYFSRSDGILDTDVIALEIEETITFDRIWVGTDNNGVRVIDYAGTLGDKSDDDLSGELDSDDNLIGLQVNSIAADRDGFIWLGTDQGLNFWFGGGGAQNRFGLISDNVQVIEIDSQNNKWIGTNAGISILSGDDNFSFSHITIENSKLVSNFVTAFVFNPENGDVWIATTNGISRFSTPFTAPKTDLQFLTGFPNPLIIGENGGKFTITNLAENSAVKIYTAEGKLIKTYERDQVLGAQVIWDGLDEDQNAVPSGIYLFVAFIEEAGVGAVGKVAVVRQ